MFSRARARARARVGILAHSLYVDADAIIGTTIFGDIDLIEFGGFDRAFVTLFQITCGATWVANLPVDPLDHTIRNTCSNRLKPACLLICLVIF